VGGPLHAPYFANIMRIRSVLWPLGSPAKECGERAARCGSGMLLIDSTEQRCDLSKAPLAITRVDARRGSNARRNSHYRRCAHSLVHAVDVRDAQLSCV
jgi:hypothetical protein